METKNRVAMLQKSDWVIESFDRLNSSSSEELIVTQHGQSRTDAWDEKPIAVSESQQRTTSFYSPPVLCGVLLGSLIAGIALAVIATIWLTPSKSFSTVVSSETFRTASVLSTNSTVSFTTTTVTTTSSSTITSTSTSATSSTSVTELITTTTTSQTTTNSTSRTTSTTSITTTTTSPPNLLLNPGADTGTLAPWIVGGWGLASIDNGTVILGYDPYSGNYQFYGGTISSGAFSNLTQSVLLLNGTQGYTEAQLDNGTLRAYISFYQQSYYQLWGTDYVTIRLVFRALNSTSISSVSTGSVSCISAWCWNSANYAIPIGTRRIDYVMVFWIQTGSYIDAYIDDNSLRVY